MKYGILMLCLAALVFSCSQSSSDKVSTDQLLVYLSPLVIITDEAQIKKVYGVDQVDAARIYFNALKHPKQLVNMEKELGFKLKGVDRENKVLLYEVPPGLEAIKLDAVIDALTSLSLADNTLFLKAGAKKDLTAYAPVDQITNYWSVPASVK